MHKRTLESEMGHHEKREGTVLIKILEKLKGRKTKL